MKSVWRENFEVKSYNVDFQQNIKPSSLMQFFQEVASNHAAELGAGYDTLISRDLFWALSRLTVDVKRMPRWGESILFETWPCGTEGLFFRRDFIVYDDQQNVIVRGVSGWLLLTVATLRPQRPSLLGVGLPFNNGRKSLEYFPERITVQTEHIAFNKTVAYNEIDQNLHVNNTRYLDWATDCFQLKHYQDYTLSRFSLEFLSETHWGDEIELRIGNSQINSDIEAFDRSSGTTLFKALLIWDTVVPDC
jgi:acyl-ACP thioesterase